MQLLDYCLTAGVSILFLAGCLLHLLENDIFSLEVIQKFKRLLYVLALEIAIDTVFALLEGSSVSRHALYLIKISELIMNPVLSFLVFDIFYDKKKNKQNQFAKNLRLIFSLAIGLNSLLQIFSAFGGHVFSIDENNIYHRGNLIGVYVMILVFTTLVLIYGIFVFSNRTQSTMKSTLLSFTLILDIGIFLRAIFPHTNYDFLCMSAAMLFLLVYYSHITLRIDPLTKLLNRQVYSKVIEKLDYTTIIFMVDANNLKTINDTRGHECGDRALKQLANALRKAYGKYAHIFRIGGDEFCVILKRDVFDILIDKTPDCDAYSAAEEFMSRLDANIEEQKKEDKANYLKYGASQGYGIFYTESTHHSEQEDLPIEKAIEFADKRMYHNKELFKKSLA